jgi:hypothetical protein
LIFISAGLAVSALAWPSYSDISYWVGVTLVLMTVAALHMVVTYPFLVPFPHIAILITGLQYVLAAWASFYYPSRNPIYNIDARLPVYLSYAGWVVVVVCLGWALSLRGLGRNFIAPASASASLLVELDVLFWIGIVCKLVSHWIGFGPLNFVLLLCADFRYLGALGRMLVFGSGWKWRILLTLAMETLFATGEAMFHSLLLWGVTVFAIYMHKYRPNKFVVASLLGLGLLTLPALQQAKVSLREKTWTGDATGSKLAGLGNAASMSKEIGDGLLKSVSGDWDADALGDIVVRYNQGWIINRVMQQVPSPEPYAKGGTLLAAIGAALLPRLLAPDKIQAGGAVNMARYAGFELGGTASMNLGYAGEMYANFGYWGGIAGCFFYALVLGLAFRWAYRRATLYPLWWAFVPYVGLTGLKAEEGIAEVTNWLFKATIVSAAIYYAFPAIRAALSGNSREDRGGMSGRMAKARNRLNGRRICRI